MKRKIKADEKKPKKKQNDVWVSTGSTLLDLAISGGVNREGGIPPGIFVEVFGPSSSGKTVLLCELAGAVKRMGGQIMFQDTEGRLNKQFARLFDLEVDSIIYGNPDTISEVFSPIREWKTGQEKVQGAFIDSLAALTTELEMNGSDPYGARRAKEFSEQLRLTCRIIASKNILMVASNQIRDVFDAPAFSEKTKSTGGHGIVFYSSLRLKMLGSTKIINKIKVGGKEIKRQMGIKTEVQVYKSSVWTPGRVAPLTIMFDYGVDDIRQNLQYIKDYTSNTMYCIGEEKLSNSMEEAIRLIEDNDLEQVLKDEVIDLWNDIESKFDDGRKKRQR